MITEEQKLKLQAYLDGELSDRETRQIAAWLESDPEAQALSAEFTGLRHLLQVGELELKLPESREFYWSKIERAIRTDTSPEVEPAGRHARSSWWFRLIAPALGAAVVLFGALALIRFSEPASSIKYLNEIETPLDDTSAISFHSEAAGMTVVWVKTD